MLSGREPDEETDSLGTSSVVRIVHRIRVSCDGGELSGKTVSRGDGS